jgi:hypothetical protein
MPSKAKPIPGRSRWKSFTRKAAIVTGTATIIGALIQGFAPIVINPVNLPPKPPGAKIDIYYLRVVTIDPNNQPINDAEVNVSISNEKKQVNNNTWQFDIPSAKKPQDGKLTISAKQEAKFLAGSQVYQLADDANPTVTITLKSAKVVRGQVVDEHGKAISEATITVVGYQQVIQTSATGEFILPVPADAEQQVSLYVQKAGYQPTKTTHKVGYTPANIVLPSLRKPPTVADSLPVKTNLQGIITDATGKPIAQAKVSLIDPASSTPIFTDNDGNFTLPIASKIGEQIRLAVTANNFQPYNRYFTVTTARITIELQEKVASNVIQK